MKISRKNEITIDNRHKIAVPREAMMLIYQHWFDVGASKHHITNDKNVNRTNLQHWYKELVIENNHFPHDLDIITVLEKFFKSLTHGNTKLAGYNLKAYLEAFRYWWRSNQEHIINELAPNLRSKPLRLESNTSTPVNVDRQLERLFGKDVPNELKKYISGATG